MKPINNVMPEEKQPRRKKATKAVALSASALPVLSKSEQARIDDVVKQAFLMYYAEESKKASTHADVQHLSIIAEEYLKTFMILGYDLNGEKVIIMNAKTLHDHDALVEHLRSTFISVVNSTGD